MNKDQLNNLITELHNHSQYIINKEIVYNMLKDYYNSSREETYELHEKLKNHFGNIDLASKFEYALLHEITIELQSNPFCSGDLYDLFTNYLDGLEKNLII